MSRKPANATLRPGNHPLLTIKAEGFMANQLDALLATFVRLRESEPDNLVGFLWSLPEPGQLPSPWNTWTLIGLTRHRQRQHWVAEIVRNRLQGDLTSLAAMGTLGHPESIRQNGPVPGMPDWEYFFHGRGCCLSHKVNGDSIDVDFWEDSADYFDTFFYENYLKSLRQPELPEQRLRELHPTFGTVSIAVADLLAIGALSPFPEKDSHPYRLTEQVIKFEDDVHTFCDCWSNPLHRVWLAALIGDWLAADEAAAGRPELAEITGPRAQQCREIREQRLRRELGEPYREADALRALADLPALEMNNYLEDALRAPPTGFVSAALEILGRKDNPQWCARVYELFSRVDPAGQAPQSHLWITSLKFLLRHGYRRPEVIASLARAGGTEIGEAVLLAFEHVPELALPLIRKGLLADIPVSRTQVAAILALIQSSWSKQELLRALEASDDQEKTADARAALLESGDCDCQIAVQKWEELNPHEREVGSYVEIGDRRLGPFYTVGEVALENRASRIAYEMEKLHDRVMKFKNIIPPEPPDRQQWWKFWKN